MDVRDDDIRRQLRLGEDSRWEFKQFEFSDDTPFGTLVSSVRNEPLLIAGTLAIKPWFD